MALRHLVVSIFLLNIILVDFSGLTHAFERRNKRWTGQHDVIHGDSVPVRPKLIRMSPRDTKIVRRIRKLSASPKSVGGPLYKEGVCYTSDCLEAALDVLKSANFKGDPCRDLYDYVCGRWKNELRSNKKQKSESDRDRYANCGLEDKHSSWRKRLVEMTAHRILGSTPKHQKNSRAFKMAKDFHTSCIEQTVKESEKNLPLVLLPILEEFGGWPVITPKWRMGKFDIIKVMVLQNQLQLRPFIEVTVGPVDNGTIRNVICLSPPEYQLKDWDTPGWFLTLPEYFSGLTGRSKGIHGNLSRQAKAVTAFKNELWSITPTPSQIERRGIKRLADYTKENPFEWKPFLEQLFLPANLHIQDDEEIFISDLDYFEAVVKLLKSTDRRTLANFAGMQIIAHFASKHVSDEIEDKHGVADSPKRHFACPREFDCATNTLKNFGMIIGAAHAANTLNYRLVAQADMMAESIREAIKDGFADLDWVDSESKEKLQKKLKEMKKSVGYPDMVTNMTFVEDYYKELHLVTGQYLANSVTLNKWKFQKSLQHLRKPITKDVNEAWFDTLYEPFQLSGFDNRARNHFFIDASQFHAPFFGHQGLDPFNYARLGWSIGHEIFHGFDSIGMDYDWEGKPTNSWDEKFLQEYQTKLKCLSDQYWNKTVRGIDGKSLEIDGTYTLEENMADNSAIKYAFRAYRNKKKMNKKEVGEKEDRELKLPGLEEITSDQLFFISYASSWCEKSTPEKLEKTILTDMHAPNRFRAIIPLKNFEPFAKAFKCPVGTPMNPKDNRRRCVVW